MSQIKKEKQTAAPQEEVEADELEPQDQQELTESVDSLLDDIDDILEENAAEFVKSYVQQGGE